MELLKSLQAASMLPQLKASTALATRTGLLATQTSSRPQIQHMNNQAVLYDTANTTLLQQGYLVNSDLYAVVNYILNKALRARFYLYEVVDEKALHDYRQLKGEGATPESLKMANTIRKKALRETQNPEIDKLLARPNPEQDFTQFAESAYAYYLLTGERFMQLQAGLYPVSSLSILPSTLMEVKSGVNLGSISGYTYRPTQTDIPVDEIIYSRKFAPAIQGNADDLRGLSPLKVLALSIQKSNEGKLSSLRQYQFGGPPGILSMIDANEPLTEDQAQEMKARITRDSGSNNRGRVHVTGMKAEWTSLGLSPVDMDVLQSGVYDLRDYCRVYGIPSEVVGDKEGSTYNNMKEARKAAIVDSVIPLINDFAQDLNTAITPYNVKGKTHVIDADTTHFPEMAEDLNALWDRLDRMPLTLNAKLEAMQYERVDSPLMDEVWMDAGKLPLSQMGAMGVNPPNDGTY